MHQPMLILGASVRAAAQSAKRAGFEPLAIDCFADEDLAELCSATAIANYPEEFSSVTSLMQPVDWIYAGGLENYPALVDKIATGHRLLGNAGTVLTQVRDPRRLHATLREAGFQAPDVYFGQDPYEIEAKSTWLRKPFRSGGGMGIRLVTKATNVASSPPATTYFQHHVEGMPVGAVFVASLGKAVLVGITRQLIGCEWAGVGDFRYCGSVGPLHLSEAVTREFEALGNCLVREFGLTGLFGVDAVVADQRVWTIEVNPRYTASVELLERAFGFPAITAHVAACRGEVFTGRLATGFELADITNQKILGKAIFYARRDIEIGPSFSKYVRQENGSCAWPTIADIPRSGTKISRGDPLVTVFAEASSDATVVHSLQNLSAQILSFFEKEHRSP